MNTYLLSVEHYFSGERYFEVPAESKADALEKGKVQISTSPEYSIGGNYNKNSLRVVKKLQQKRKGE